MPAYEPRTYRIAPGGMDTVAATFRELVLPMLPDDGIESVGCWITPDGATLHRVVRHDSLETIQANWDGFHADPRWKPGLAAREGDRLAVTGTHSTPLLGIEGLPPLAVDRD